MLAGAVWASGAISFGAPADAARIGQRPPDGTREEAPSSVPLLPDDVEIAARILELEAGGRGGDAADLLGHADPRIRARAALAAGRGGWPDRHATLLTLLRDEQVPVRAAAAFALGGLRFDLEPALAVARRERAATALAARLSDVPEVALPASLALGELAVAATTSSLGELLRRRPQTAPEVAAAALWAHGRAPGATAGPVLGWLDHGDVRVRLAAVGALVEAGDPNSLPALVSVLDDPEPAVRAAAVRGLADRAGSLLERRLDELLQERSPEVVMAALAYLEGAWSAEDAEPERLAQVLRRSLDRDLHVRRAALVALGSVATRRGAAADRLLQALEEPEPAVRAEALRALTLAGGDLTPLGLEWAHGRWRQAGASAPLHGVEAAALAEALARSGRDRDLAWLRELAGSAEDRLREAAYPWLVEVEPARAMELARRWLRGPPDEGAGWGLWGSLQLYRAHRLPEESERPSLVDDAWAVLRSTSSAAESRLRGMALELVDDLAPTLLDRRIEYLTRLPWRDVRLTLERLGRSWPESDGPALVADPGEYVRAARRVLAAQDRPPALRLVSERGDAVIRVRADRAPLAALDVLDRVGPATGADLTVRGWSPAAGVVRLDAGEWPREPGWPPAAVPLLAAPGMVRRDRPRGPPGAGTWAFLPGGVRGPAGEAWGRVEEGIRVLSRLQPGDRVRLESEGP